LEQNCVDFEEQEEEKGDELEEACADTSVPDLIDDASCFS